MTIWLFVTMVIEFMLHGLRRLILFLNHRRIYPLSSVSVYMKEFQFSYRLWAVSAINTAQDDMPWCGNSLISSSCNPAELSFQLLPRILLFLGFTSAIIKDFSLKIVIRSNDCVSQTNVWINLFDKQIAITLFTITASLEGLLRLVYRPY